MIEYPKRCPLIAAWFAPAILVLAAAGPTFAQPASAGVGEGLEISNCIVSEIEGPRVPAEEEGLVVAVLVKPGMNVQRGDLIAKLDDRRAQLVKTNAEIDHRIATYQATNDINVRYAASAARVAEKEFEMAKEANAAVARALSPTEIRRLELEFERATLGTEQAAMELKVQGFNADKAKAELDAVEVALQRRQILAPIDGVIVDIDLDAGEWVSPGDTVCHLVRMDRLQVQGFVNINQLTPSQVIGRPVLVKARIGGRVEEFRGNIVNAIPKVLAGGQYRVRAEVDNRQQNGQWVLLPGLSVDMTIR